MNAATPDIQLVIFDNDGVLVDTEIHANQVLADLLTEHGIPTSLNESFERYLGRSIESVRSVCEEASGRRLTDSFESDYHERLFRRLDGGLEAVPGVGGVIEVLELPFCVASSGSRERIRRTLRAVGLWPRFSGRAFSAEDVSRGKPAPDLFLHVAANLKVAPEKCVVIEDSPMGIAAANAAGMNSLGFAYRTPADKLSGASMGVFAEMAELPGLL